MALTSEEAAVNAKVIELEALLAAMFQAKAAGAKTMFIFADEWPATAHGTDLNAKFAVTPNKQTRISHFVKVATSATSNVWALPGYDLGRIPLSFRITNHAGDLS